MLKITVGLLLLTGLGLVQGFPGFYDEEGPRSRRADDSGTSLLGLINLNKGMEKTQQYDLGTQNYAGNFFAIPQGGGGGGQFGGGPSGGGQFGGGPSGGGQFPGGFGGNQGFNAPFGGGFQPSGFQSGGGFPNFPSGGGSGFQQFSNTRPGGFPSQSKVFQGPGRQVKNDLQVNRKFNDNLLMLSGVGI